MDGGKRDQRQDRCVVSVRGKGETKDRADICRDPKGDRTEKGGQNCREAEGRGACGTDSGCVWRCCAAAYVYLRT